MLIDTAWYIERMIIVMLILLGLALGSFVNALVWRVYQQEQPKKKRVASDKDLSVATGRSMCPHCRHTLGVADLIPVLSWVSLGGKCRYCHKPIGWQYPLVELATAAFFILSYVAWPMEWDAAGIAALGVWLASLVGLMALLVYDLRWMLLPNRIVFPLIGLGVGHVLLQAALRQDWTLLVDGILSLGVAGGIFYVLFQISAGRWIGGGDVKLGFALGLLLLSPAKSLLMLFVASVIGTFVSLTLMSVKRLGRKSIVPFGPFLIVATIITQLFGADIIDWYLKTAGLR